MSATQMVPSTERVENYILLIRSQKVILDADLAELYGVTTKRLNEQVKRNQDRFPVDFMFKLTDDEKQQVVAICDHLKNLKFSRTNPNAFTEHGVLMAASVLNTPRAIEVSVLVVRTFVKLREILSTHTDLNHKLKELENKILSHDKTLHSLVISIRRLMNPPLTSNKRPIGFHPWEDDENGK
jgi:hypothetical protein